jgi:hypothetical protein
MSDSRTNLMRKLTLTKTEIVIKDCTINNLIKRIEKLEEQRRSCSPGGAVDWFSSGEGENASIKRKLLLVNTSSKKEQQGEEQRCNKNGSFSIIGKNCEEKHCIDSKAVGSSLGREFTEATKQVTHKDEIINGLLCYINVLETSRGYGSSLNRADDSRHDCSNGDHVGCHMIAVSIGDNNVSERDSCSYDDTMTESRDQSDPKNIIGMTIQVDRPSCRKCKGYHHSRGTKRKQFFHKSKKTMLEPISEQETLIKEDELYSPNSQNQPCNKDNFSFWGDFLTCCGVDTTNHH